MTKDEAKRSSWTFYEAVKIQLSGVEKPYIYSVAIYIE